MVRGRVRLSLPPSGIDSAHRCAFPKALPVRTSPTSHHSSRKLPLCTQPQFCVRPEIRRRSKGRVDPFSLAAGTNSYPSKYCTPTIAEPIAHPKLSLTRRTALALSSESLSMLTFSIWPVKRRDRPLIRLRQRYSIRSSRWVFCRL
jgi:hypothetical protein